MNQQVQISATSSSPYRFTVEQFLALSDQGMFSEFAKSELIEGEISVMNAQHSRHARVKTRLAILLGNALAALNSPLEPQVEVSVRLAEDSLPEPDITLTSYRGSGVVPVETVALVIEVSDTTLDHDLGRKADLYEKAGVPEYWVIDLNENRALLHMLSPDGDYSGQFDVPFGEKLHSGLIAGLSVATDGLD